MLKKLDSKHADIVEQAILGIFKDYDILSITSDNGNEFMNHENISDKLDLDYYFANPYALF